MTTISSKVLNSIFPLVCLSGILLLAGCGQGGPKVTSEMSKAFDNAPLELRQAWEKAIAADKAKDFVTAATILDNLSKMTTLSEQQVQALNVEREAFGLRLMKAVNNNDSTAIKAAQISKNTRSR